MLYDAWPILNDARPYADQIMGLSFNQFIFIIFLEGACADLEGDPLEEYKSGVQKMIKIK
jgi:hypothetical protein